jgi:hypothetical protein
MQFRFQSSFQNFSRRSFFDAKVWSAANVFNSANGFEI